MVCHGMLDCLLPPHWQSIYLPLWFQEDFPTLDVASAIVGDSPATAQIIFKSESVAVMYIYHFRCTKIDLNSAF
jgi:hypothetical protein